MFLNTIDDSTNRLGFDKARHPASHTLNKDRITGNYCSCAFTGCYCCVKQSSFQARHHNFASVKPYKILEFQLAFISEHPEIAYSKRHVLFDFFRSYLLNSTQLGKDRALFNFRFIDFNDFLILHNYSCFSD